MAPPRQAFSGQFSAALYVATAFLGILLVPARSVAAEPVINRAPADASVEAQIGELERRIQILTEEVRRLREARTLPTESIDDEQRLEAMYGHGPAASQIYVQTDRGLSLGGYGEFNFKKEVSDKNGNDDVFDFVRLVAYLGYKFNDRILFNSEVEVEHASTSSDDGEVALEFGHLDFLLTPAANLRAGLLLVPVGILNEVHEPPFFHGNDRPAVERQVIPSTWRANGAGFFGELLPGLDYRTYAVTSLRASQFTSANLRDGRQNGSDEKAEDFSWVGRLDYEPRAGLEFGTSAYLGNQGQDDEIVLERDPVTGDPLSTGSASAFMQMYEGHVQWRWWGVEARALGVWVELEDAASLSVNAQEPIGQRMTGWYAELAYDIMPLVLPHTEQYLAPWFRYSRYNTQDEVARGFTPDDNDDRRSIDMGIDYKPIPEVVLKLDYRNEDAAEGDRPDIVRVGAGFVF